MIFTGTQIKIELDTGTDLSAATGLRIDYTKPDGTTGSWTGSASTTKITYTASTSDLDLKGTWKFQAVATLGSNQLKGDIVEQLILSPIKTS